jgi:hypothetical protein
MLCNRSNEPCPGQCDQWPSEIPHRGADEATEDREHRRNEGNALFRGLWANRPVSPVSAMVTRRIRLPTRTCCQCLLAVGAFSDDPHAHGTSRAPADTISGAFGEREFIVR